MTLALDVKGVAMTNTVRPPTLNISGQGVIFYPPHVLLRLLRMPYGRIVLATGHFWARDLIREFRVRRKMPAA